MDEKESALAGWLQKEGVQLPAHVTVDEVRAALLFDLHCLIRESPVPLPPKSPSRSLGEVLVGGGEDDQMYRVPDNGEQGQVWE
ncbi:MAG: hypothetical protein PHI23_02750 [Candidatus Peribacteraceae bacterium]|nr:hypothetical protein [Candidatus Peribacteraceae bacterium]